ncbi:MAG: VWA domain-containing protein [Planctomycetota bacterium]
MLSPAGRVVNKGFLRHRFSEIGPEGWTNLSAGLLEAVAQVDSTAAPDQDKRIILLTDGLANRGVTNADDLVRMAESANARGIAISTMGVGAAFDGNLLKRMANKGGGSYAYVRDAEDIPAVMEAEISGFLAVTAQNARLEIAAQDGTKIAKVYGRPPAALPSDNVAIDLGDLREGEHGTFLVELTPGAFRDGATAGAMVTLSMDLPNETRRVQETARPEAKFTSDRSEVGRSERKAVTLAGAALVALEKAEQAAAGLDSRLMSELSNEFASLHGRVRQAAIQLRDQELLNYAFMLEHFMEELVAASKASLLHDHDAARRNLLKSADFERYLLEHHRK